MVFNKKVSEILVTLYLLSPGFQKIIFKKCIETYDFFSGSKLKILREEFKM